MGTHMEDIQGVQANETLVSLPGYKKITRIIGIRKMQTGHNSAMDHWVLQPDETQMEKGSKCRPNMQKVRNGGGNSNPPHL